MNIEIVVGTIIPILGAILVYVLVPLFKARTTAEERQDIYFYIELAVKAAEQIFNYKHAGKEKKQFVIDKIMDKGLKVSEQDLDLMIESAVQEINKAKEVLSEE